jgi:voltage-gated potassium channel
MVRKKSLFEKLRQKTFIIIYGTKTVSGRLFDLILLGVIVLSVILVMLETVQGFDTEYHKEVVFLEWVITIFFTVEYILRIITTRKPLRYIFSFYGIIDLVAVLPMYMSLFIVGSSVLSIVRAFRLLRLFKILNHPQFTGQSLHLKEAMIASRGKIVVFIYFVLISAIFIGSLMYVIEGPESGFTSIPISIYWTIVTLTTVGYGDISPITPLGQFIASFVMILGYGIIAVPTGIVSAEYTMTNKNRNGAIIPNKTDKSCSECGKNDQRKKASYCYNCGNELNNE